MTEKYISLFPSSTEKSESEQVDSTDHQLVLPRHLTTTPAEDDKPAATRLALLAKLKQLMLDKTEAEKQGVSLRPEETLKEDGSARTMDAKKLFASTEAATVASDKKESEVEVVEEEADDFFE